ncbi:MAG: M2 family metallopeptidase, partial [Actinomycetes bacterium]
MTARLQALGTAMPEHYVFKQTEIVEAFFARQPGWDPAWAEVFAAAGVERRSSVVDPGWYGRPRSTADRMREFAPAARRLGAEAARRALEQAGLDLLANQIPEGDRAKLVALQAKVEHAFATVRGRVGDRQLANNELERILADSGDPAERRAAWEAGKQVGAVVADDVLALVELRNRVARERGHRDWFAFALATGDIDEAWLERMLDQVELATREPFLAVKAELDARLAARFGVAVDDLHPWHYGDLFFQRYDGDAEADLGPLLEGSDTVALTVAAYDGMGLETRHLLERSDLYPRPGKDQHAFCLDVDRAGDIRVLANLAPGEEWLDVLPHEVGHAVYDDHLDRSLPWVLRRPPQGLVTEAVALMLGRLRRDPEFLVGVLGAEEVAARAMAGPSRQ